MSASEQLGLREGDFFAAGRAAVKVDPAVALRPRDDGRPESRLVLVTAITPTRAGEGKTTVAIGLADALTRLGESACVALREPSLGPSLGGKGGATGGGKSRLQHASDIDLHFTGDFHAVTTATNLLASLVDHHLWNGNALGIDPERVGLRRVTDLEERSLRAIVTGLGGAANGVPRETGFDITPASELMACLCLAESLDDLRARLARMVVAFTRDGVPVTAGELGGVGAALALLRDALWPNLVRTLEGTPALVHGGPFANIAHGCSSVLATRVGLALADWVVTEAGFGSDLGAEKFFHVKCRSAGLAPAAVVIVATLRALAAHGLPNLAQHIANVRAFGQRPVVALNRFDGDTDDAIDRVRAFCAERDVPFAVTTHYAEGGAGAVELAEQLRGAAAPGPTPPTYLYELDAPVPAKIEAVARTIYGARGVVLAPAARRDVELLERHGLDALPICIAKTERSLSDDPRLAGRPRDFDLHVARVLPATGAGFLVVTTGDILRMPGLPRSPRALSVDVDDDGGRVTGLE